MEIPLSPFPRTDVRWDECKANPRTCFREKPKEGAPFKKRLYLSTLMYDESHDNIYDGGLGNASERTIIISTTTDESSYLQLFSATRGIPK